MAFWYGYGYGYGYGWEISYPRQPWLSQSVSEFAQRRGIQLQVTLRRALFYAVPHPPPPPTPRRRQVKLSE